MQTTQLLHDERVHGSTVWLGYASAHGAGNDVQGLFIWVRHHRVDGLLDGIAVG
jgi:hypothetical protein